MMHYTLRCADGHRFEGWFGSSDAFDAQRAGGHIACPTCGTDEVDRALMAPAVVAASGDRQPTAPSEKTSSGADGGEPTAHASREVALMDERARHVRAFVKAMHDAVKEHGVDVGREFPDVARRMHYGEVERSGIYGQADASEARELIEEGIDILPLPMLPDERN